MSVAYDSVGPVGGGGAGHTGISNLTWTHTTIAASTYVIVAASPDNVPTTDTTTCTLDGNSMTSLGSIASGSGGTTGYLQAWYLTGIAAGAHSIIVAYNSAAADCTGGSVAYSGATGLGTFYTSATSATGSDCSIADSSNTNGNIILGFCAAGSAITQASGTGVNGRFLNNLQGGAGDSTGNIAGADAPATGSSVTITWPCPSTVGATAAIEVQGAPAVTPAQLNQGQLPNYPAIITSNAGWRNAGHSR